MRIAIFGTGAAGGCLGARLVQAGGEVAFITRGAHLAAIRGGGLHVETPHGTIVARPALATDDPMQVGVTDAVLVGVKTWQVRAVAPELRTLLGPGTIVLPLQNGIEAAADLSAALGAEHVLGGVCETLSWRAGPGHIKSLSGVHLVRLGELDNRPSARVESLRRTFEAAGVRADIPADIHRALWDRFLLAVSWGGLGAICRVPVGLLRSVPGTRRLLKRCMREVFAVARARGVHMDQAIIARSLSNIDALDPAAVTSLQRDIEADRPSELEAWTGAVVRLGRDAGVATPLHELIYHALTPRELRARCPPWNPPSTVKTCKTTEPDQNATAGRP